MTKFSTTSVPFLTGITGLPFPFNAHPSFAVGHVHNSNGGGSFDSTDRPLVLNVSTYTCGGLNDPVLDTAAKRMGRLIADSAVTVGDSLFRSTHIKVILSQLKNMDAATRLNALSGISESVFMKAPSGSQEDMETDFRVMRLSQREQPQGNHIRQYRFFYDNDLLETVVNYMHHWKDSPVGLCREFLKADIDLMLESFDQLCSSLEKGDESGISFLNFTKGVAIGVETAAMQFADDMLEDDQIESMLNLFWDCLIAAHNAYADVDKTSEAFERCLRSLSAFLNR